MAKKNKYWQDLDEYAQTPRYQKASSNEFQKDLPIGGGLSDKLVNAKTPRRDFLKFVGFSTAAATLAASCEMPVRHAIPYAIKPDDSIQPGVPNYYASTFVDNGEVLPVVVKTRDGRPILIQGNDQSSLTGGGSSTHSVAATLSLYDNARMRGPHANKKQVNSFKKIDEAITNGLAGVGGKPIYLVTGTINSPTLKKVIAQFLDKYPTAKHVQYDPVSCSGMILANEASYGIKALPSYHFDQAKTILSIGADFLGTWLSPTEFTHGYMKNRRVKGKNAKTATMSKHYQIEANITNTGIMADERASCRPSEYGKVAAALYQAIQSGTKPSFQSEKLNNLIIAAAKDLKAGNGLVVSGSNDMAVQTIVNAINAAIGANGTTVNFGATSNYKQGMDSEMVAFANDMKSGNVGAVIFHGVNPAYDYFNKKDIISGLKKVKLSVSLNDRMDETTELCRFAIPDHHWLESWGDAEPKSGYYTFMQPTIAPLFKTRSFGDSLLKWSGESGSYYDLFNDFWKNKLGGQSKFDEALQAGIVEPSEESTLAPGFNGDVASAISKVNGVKSSDIEVMVYTSNAIGYGGIWSNNPWLQELPDPITKACWDNYICMSPKMAHEKYDIFLDQANEVEQKQRLMDVQVGKETVTLPMVIVPGMNNNVIAIALGYGRNLGAGPAAHNVGRNVYGFVNYDGQTFSYSAPAKITLRNEVYPVAITQTHMSTEGRPVVHEFSLEDFKKDPFELLKERKDEVGSFASLSWKEGAYSGHENPENDFDFEEGFRKHGTLYPDHPKPGIHWGMSIDLNACTGCAACVIACQAENNVSVVGKDEVLQGHDMAWLRIDRYYSGNPNDPDTIQGVFQPMMCQHCDNAPCENVCPVAATSHSSEGLNQMTYNRCIGTKYCANNCPFKVRRFNWFDWNGADCFKDNLYQDGTRDDMNSDLTRMLLNPDVTVRSRGVMEKCTLCVQRLQDAKLDAKKAGRPLKDGEAKTACQVACASNAISFGNVNDKESEIYKIRHEDNKERTFYVLEELHVLPNVSYLSKIRNADKVLLGSKEDDIYNKHI